MNSDKQKQSLKGVLWKSAGNFIKKWLQHTCDFVKFLKNTYFVEHLQTAASRQKNI